MRFIIWSAICLVFAWSARSSAQDVPALAWPIQLPLGFDRRPLEPPDNPLTEAKARLGRQLFYDTLLSPDGRIACVTCHQPSHGFAGLDPVAVGAQGRRGRRHAPSLLNRGYGQSFFWDGREKSLEGQSLRPLSSDTEMAGLVELALDRIRAVPDYREQFRQAFGGDINACNLSKAIASFERTLIAGDSRVDRFRAGHVDALTSSETHGLWLYESRGGCWRCHSGANFTDESFHNTGVSWGRVPLDLGRLEVTGKEKDRGRFKTPTLRGVSATSPYMHDGSLATLEDVVAYYNRGGNNNPNLDPLLKPLDLSADDCRDVVAFLKALSR